MINGFSIEKFKHEAKRLKDNVVLPVSKFLHKLNVSPSFLSVLGLISGLVGAFFLVYSPKWVWLFILLHLIFDNLDGALARYTNTASLKGEWQDYAIDRIVRIAYIISTIIIFNGTERLICVWILITYVFMNYAYLNLTKHYKYYTQLDYIIYILFIISIYWAIIFSVVKLAIDIIILIYRITVSRTISFHQKK
jgi:phosphatidylglycerophosphate synthase